MDLLRWFRFGWAIDVGWDQATRVEARDFCRWMGLTDKQRCRRRGLGRRAVRGVLGVPNAVTGKPGAGAEVRGVDAGALGDGAAGVLRLPPRRRDGSDGQPVPAGCGPPVAGACASQPDGAVPQRAGGALSAAVSRRVPRAIPDELFNRVFAELGSHRDRALVALWVSTGARAVGAARGALQCDVDPGRAADHGGPQGDARACSRSRRRRMRSCGCGSTSRSCGAGVPPGRDDPLWWTLRRPFRPLTYHAAQRCSSAPPPRWAPTGRCTTCGIPPPTGWRGTRSCR